MHSAKLPRDLCVLSRFVCRVMSVFLTSVIKLIDLSVEEGRMGEDELRSELDDKENLI